MLIYQESVAPLRKSNKDMFAITRASTLLITALTIPAFWLYVDIWRA